MANDTSLEALRAQIAELEAQASAAENDGSPESLQRSFKLLDAAETAAKQIDGRLDGLLSELDAMIGGLEAAQPSQPHGGAEEARP